ncbi:NADP-dependent oxidoreductase [Muriicola sp. Z0-33]|uniref:NADP-dependent oxidoreductase n=1 Tax=Muriicola sp. Z0-33 TaxID=2816957 RepID=UPI002238E35F|nr:NADP-dependent oxidoreductase [Muriicola sp. Z0-33]MCW5515267.1 NADP-dependent oxidoreductase [Muriicola sp. Z0-33]
MKAIILEEVGAAENLVIKDIKPPEVKEDEVLVKVKAIAINPVDYKVRANKDMLRRIYGEQMPAILGWDIAGIVETTGQNVTQFTAGDKVFGMVNFPGAGSAYAEFVAAPQEHLAKIPEGISFEAAAATTLAALTALQVLESRVGEGDKVLIHAGSGGVGHFAIQIAKALGAYVISTSSAKNKDFIMALGADEHIDYRTQVFHDILGDLDFVFDMFGGDILFNSVKVVRNGGTVISIMSPVISDETMEKAKQRNVNVSNLMVQSNGNDMNTLKNMLVSGVLKPHIFKTFPFDQMALAHKQQETGRTVGKIVVAL